MGKSSRCGGGKALSKAQEKSLASLESSKKAADFEDQLQKLVGQVRAKPELLARLRAVADSYGTSKDDQKQVDTRLVRGVRCLIDVPQKIQRQALKMVATVDESHWSNNPDDANQIIFIWVAGGVSKLRLPRLRMELQEFLDWYQERYVSMGSMLSKFDLNAFNVDVDWALGAASFVPPRAVFSDCVDDMLVTHVRRNAYGEIRNLPPGFQPQYVDVGNSWILESNWSMEAVNLVFVGGDHRKLALSVLFDVPASGVKVVMDAIGTLHISNFLFLYQP